MMMGHYEPAGGPADPAPFFLILKMIINWLFDLPFTWYFYFPFWDNLVEREGPKVEQKTNSNRQPRQKVWAAWAGLSGWMLPYLLNNNDKQKGKNNTSSREKGTVWHFMKESGQIQQIPPQGGFVYIQNFLPKWNKTR